MRIAARVRSLARNVFRRPRVERDLEDEVASAVEMLTDENVAAGMSPEDARRKARIDLGGVTQVQEAVRESRAGAGLEAFWQDFRDALRRLGRSPGFSAVAVAKKSSQTTSAVPSMAGALCDTIRPPAGSHQAAGRNLLARLFV